MPSGPRGMHSNMWWAFFRVLFRGWEEREYDYERRRQRSRSKEKDTRRRDRSRSKERWRDEDYDHGDRPRGRRVSRSCYLSPCVVLCARGHVASDCVCMYVCECGGGGWRGGILHCSLSFYCVC